MCCIFSDISQRVVHKDTPRVRGSTDHVLLLGRDVYKGIIDSHGVGDSRFTDVPRRVYRGTYYAVRRFLLVQSAAASFDRTSSRLIRFKPPLITFLTIHYEAQCACMQNKQLHLFNSDNETRGPPSHQWPRCQRVTTSGRCSG